MSLDDHPLLPGDPADEALVALTHPGDHAMPVPSGAYQLLVIGGGPAGLVAAFGAAGLGARVAIVERGLLGGDCLNHGCVPSKALLAAAHAAHAARTAHTLGVRVGDVEVDVEAVFARMRGIRADIAHHDSVERLEAAGIDVYLGAGRFTGHDTFEVGGTSLRFARAVVATGARAARPPIPGLDTAGVLTNETLFARTTAPRRLVVLGAGPIGAEMAQAFARFGSEVTLVDQAPRVLPREDPDAAELVADALSADGVTLHLGAQVTGVHADGDIRRVDLTVDGADTTLVADEVLVALGRRPNVEDLGLDQAGIAVDRRGVTTDRYLRTTNPRVFAAGDVAGRHQFTHSADAHARIVVQNALFLPTASVDDLVVPWATYTEPEVAHVGASFDAVVGRADLQVFTVPLGDTDRGRTDGTTTGFARVHADARGRVVAGTIVGPGAGDLINELAVVQTNGLTLGSLAKTIHAYPTRAEVLKKLGDAYNRTRLTPGRARMVRTWLRWRLG